MEDLFSHKIIHIDMDAFFASIEQRDYPELRGKPIAVGYPERRSVVAAASYEARKYGIHSAMPSIIAMKKCPRLIFAPPRFEVYRQVSLKIMQIFNEYTDLVEPMSLDEAYLDVTNNKKNLPSATKIAQLIKADIKKQTELTASAGVSFNKFLAKIASDYKKPDGLMVIRPEDADKFIDSLLIGKIPYVGEVTEKKMKELGIFTGGDLKKLPLDTLTKHFGKTGIYYFQVVRNQWFSPVTTEHERKSIGAERTFDEDITDGEELLKALKDVCEILIKRMNKKNLMGKTVTIKIRYSDFETKTRSKTLNFYINPDYELYSIARELFLSPIMPIKPVRLLGVQVSTLQNIDEKMIGQLTLDF